MNIIPHRILVATDFSPTGDRAQTMGLILARAFDAELHIVHVQELLDDAHLEREQRVELERLLASADDQRREALQAPMEEPGVAVHTHLIRGLSAAESITETCSELRCDLIIMGTHGRRGLSQLLLGSVAEKVVRSSPVPVLTIRPDAMLPTAGIERLLVPHDFSDHSGEAVRYAGEWARSLAAEITLLHSVEPVVYPEFYAVDLLPDEMVGRLRKRSQEALEAAAAELLPGVNSRAIVRVGRAGETIVAETESDDFTLVIMGTRGLSAIEHLLLGSVAENVLRRSAVPLLAVRG